MGSVTVQAETSLNPSDSTPEWESTRGRGFRIDWTIYGRSAGRSEVAGLANLLLSTARIIGGSESRFDERCFLTKNM